MIFAYNSLISVPQIKKQKVTIKVPIIPITILHKNFLKKFKTFEIIGLCFFFTLGRLCQFKNFQ
jgi:hypothetical protein